ncbi:hydroxyisourate hydrolase [Melittangium boletus]|uniref:5-hydroxyisourate hydrolase n=1 Tax=Melittangium boletus DSM 14713 TaxID=1294270 RepID=A0A250IAY7_9BACT|nr:hydroxyisourate hydrolase [Melittangium boletus]ATB29029.1 5-hydroxyisourate hydrolase [Melittangium boletus DSM 14713]
MSTLSTHVLDTQWGRPASGVPITLEQQAGDTWRELARGTTNADGRVRDFLPANTRLEPGTYRMTFHTAEYFRAHQTKGFYPYVSVVFELASTEEHYHVPLLLSPFGYSTYRGS